MRVAKLIATICIPIAIAGCSRDRDRASEWEPVARDRALEVITTDAPKILKSPHLVEIQSGMKTLAIRPVGAPQIAIYKYDSPRLCGVGGCLHSLYSQDKRIGRVLLDDAAQISTKDNCLIFKQPHTTHQAVLKFCYAKPRYVQQPLTREDLKPDDL